MGNNLQIETHQSKHSLLTAEETSLLRGERTKCSTGEGNNTSSSSPSNTGRNLQPWRGYKCQARIRQLHWGWTVGDHTGDKLPTFSKEIPWLRESETNPSSTSAMLGMKRDSSPSPTALDKLPTEETTYLERKLSRGHMPTQLGTSTHTGGRQTSS